MFFHPKRVCCALAAVVVLVVAATMPAVHAQSAAPGPAASGVTEEQLLQQSRRIQGTVNIQNKREGVLEQPLGRNWRVYHEIALNWFGGAMILGVTALLGTVYLLRGPIRIAGGRSGRKIVRFSAFERFVHWLAGVPFVILAITGLNFTYGKKVLLPVIGPEAFSTVTEAGKFAHNFLSFPFVIGVAAMFVLWARQNLPTKVDIEWLKRGGGFVGKDPPAWRFNAGQKLLFWVASLGTVLIAIPGYMLIFPFYFADIGGMQIAEIVHSLGAIGFIAAIIGHVYIGSIGMEGGFESMVDGEVELNWAKQHHSLWAAQEVARVREAASIDAPATPAE